MAEDYNTETRETSIPGLSTDDITPTFYEGGFKTWECAVDLAKYLTSKNFQFEHLRERDVRIVELGAGSALPSLSLLQQWKRSQGSTSPALPNLHLILADYNQSVLELATIPNLFLTWNSKSISPSGECEITPSVLAEFLQDLWRHNVTIWPISGSWGNSFVTTISPFLPSGKPIDTIILASETIYSPSSIRAFIHVLLELISNTEKSAGVVKAWVAAKRVYFGVGGGVNQFLRILEQMGGAATVVWENDGPGVGRVILEVVKARH